MIDKISNSFLRSVSSPTLCKAADNVELASVMEVEIFEEDSGKLFFIAWELVQYPAAGAFLKKGQWCEGRYLPSSEPINFQYDKSPARNGLYLHRCEQVGKLLAQM